MYRCTMSVTFGSFQFVTKDHKKGTVYGHHERPDRGWKKIYSRKIAAGVICRLQFLLIKLEYKPNRDKY